MLAGDDVLLPSSDSFWEIDCYKTTVKRTEDGLHMCGELMKLIAERAEIEMKYSTKLKMWCKKWNDIIDKGPEYGTNKEVLLGSLLEADAMGDVHSGIKDRLMEVHADLRKWKNENFKKAMVGGCKETKQFEDDFKKAQKPWAKKLAKVQKCRKDYFAACKQEVASQQALSQSGSGAMTEDQVKKLQEKVERCQKDVSQTRDKYEDTLKDLNSYKSIYIIDMKDVFDNTQKFEEKRLEYFKDILIGIQKSLDLTLINEISVIYEQFQQKIGLSDASKDLAWWSQNRGADMPMNWPEFEEFSSEPSSLTRKDKTRASVPISSNNDTFRSTKSSSHNLAGKEPVQESKAVTAGVVAAQTPSKTNAVQRQRQKSYDPDLNPFEDEPDSSNKEEAKVPSDPSSGAAEASLPSDGKIGSTNAAVSQTNPFDEDDDDEEEEDFSNQVGIPVQALFDYVGQEKDELSFKSGDKFEKLKDRDDQGWCTGRRDGRIGLFPDNYVKVIDE